MKKILFLISSILLLIIVYSCVKLDTYDLPGETLQGTLTDAGGNPYISEEPNGFQIRMYYSGSKTPRDFWGKADGTFLNTKIFKGTYKILPWNGAFFPMDTVVQEISGITTNNFTVKPFLTINVTFTQVGKDLQATYTISQAAGAGKITAARLLVTKWNPRVGMNYSDKSVTRTLSGIPDATIVTTPYTDIITGYLESGVTYYARVAVLSTNSLGKYNFSAVQQIVVP
jgi:hypothetical protein